MRHRIPPHQNPQPSLEPAWLRYFLANPGVAHSFDQELLQYKHKVEQHIIAHARAMETARMPQYLAQLDFVEELRQILGAAMREQVSKDTLLNALT